MLVLGCKARQCRPRGLNGHHGAPLRQVHCSPSACPNPALVILTKDKYISRLNGNYNLLQMDHYWPILHVLKVTFYMQVFSSVEEASNRKYCVIGIGLEMN
jgi:hypothetical protein